MYEGQTIIDNGINWKVKNVSNKPHSLPYIGGGGGVYNTFEKITTSGIFTAPCDGWYEFTLKGAGAGGDGSLSVSGGASFASGGGAEGGTSFVYEWMNEGDTVTIVIGAGGNGGSGVSVDSDAREGKPGGNTTITVNGITYTAGGGNTKQLGGTGDIRGCTSGNGLNAASGGSQYGFPGGGSGGGTYYSIDGVDGGGGSGRYANSTINLNGGKGGNGFVFIRYFDPNK